MDNADELCRDYSCCGLSLPTLHALVDHFEECHVLVGGIPQPHAAQMAPGAGVPTGGVFDPDDMELDSPPSSGASTPPQTPVSPIGATAPVSALETAALLRAKPFLGWQRAPSPEDSAPAAAGGVPPALLFSPTPTPSGSRDGSPTPSYFSQSQSGSASGQTTPGGTNSALKSAAPRASTTLSRPGSSLLLSKPFKCPKPNCNKSYKQANGLKYHITHGSCNFAPPKEVEEVNAVLAARQKDGQTLTVDATLSLESLGMNEQELREVEREAERRLKPFACGIGECTRRYKNMNGLRYHYQHSGDHGAIGLALLASGQHECLRNGHNKRQQQQQSQQQQQPMHQQQQQQQIPSAAMYAQQAQVYAQPTSPFTTTPSSPFGQASAFNTSAPFSNADTRAQQCAPAVPAAFAYLARGQYAQPRPAQ